MPRLKYREQKTDENERAPVSEKDPRLAEAKKLNEKSGGEDEHGDLGPPECEIRKP